MALPASPRCYDRHARKGTIARVRHSKQLKSFLAVEAARLSSTSSVIFTKLQKYGAERVKAAANLAALP